MTAKPATQPNKALAAAVFAFFTALFATVQGRTDLGTMGAADWLIVVGSALVTAAGVYFVPNPPKGERRRRAIP